MILLGYNYKSSEWCEKSYKILNTECEKIKKRFQKTKIFIKN